MTQKFGLTQTGLRKYNAEKGNSNRNQRKRPRQVCARKVLASAGAVQNNAASVGEMSLLITMALRWKYKTNKTPKMLGNAR
jgi:hypothetical protein